MANGLLCNGNHHDVPNAEVIAPRELPWCLLQARDCRPRVSKWVRQGTFHTTGGVPLKVVDTPQPNPLHRAQEIADYWRINPRGAAMSGGAHAIVAGRKIVQLEDLVTVEAYHATTVNPFSYGVEMAQDADGTIHLDTLETAVELAFATANILSIPMQTTSLPYHENQVIERLKEGPGIGNVVGFFGHRNNAWMFASWLTPEKRAIYPHGYADRGRGDPGDEWYAMIKARGAMAFNFDLREEVAYWSHVQTHMNEKYNCRLVVDGICGPGTTTAMRAHGLWNGGVFTQ